MWIQAASVLLTLSFTPSTIEDRAWQDAAITLLLSMPQPTPTSIVGLWDSATTSTGGIGSTLEFRADGTFVEATTVIVNAYYRVTAGRLVIDERPVGPQAPAAMAVRVEVEGDVLRWTGPDGAMVRKERLGRPEAGKPAIVGAWRYRHDTGTTAFDVLKGSELLLTRPSQADVAMKVVLMGDDLTLSTNDRTSSYRRDTAGPWYERERISK